MQTEFIFATLSEEKKTGELLPLPKNFYEKAEQSIRKLASAGNPSETQNKIATLNALRARRTQKILVYIAYGKTMPNALPAEEEVLFTNIMRVLNREPNAPKAARIRILIKIPEIITNKGKKLGPYNEGEILQLEDPDDAEFIINNRIGEILSQ